MALGHRPLPAPLLRRPRLPQELHLAGKTLKKAAEWQLEGVQSVVFIPEGESMRDSSLQVGILTSTEHRTAHELNVWIMKQYRLAQVGRWHESVEAETACKIGQTKVPFREFAAVHLCKDGKAWRSASKPTRSSPWPCRNRAPRTARTGTSCAPQWDVYRVDLEAIADRVIAQR